MQLSLYKNEIFNQYKSNSQIARVLSENWFHSEMYCPCCLNTNIENYPNNQKATDFFCSNCRNEFQTKCSNKKFTRKVLDGEFNTMMNFINSNKSPNLFLMQYSNQDWFVKNLFLIPKFFIVPSIIEKRKPLSTDARRAGWIGCNFLLDNLPEEGKIAIIKDEKIIEKELVNKKWARMIFLNNYNSSIRGWTSDVLKCINKISKEEFVIKDIYEFKNYLQRLHPNNKHIEAKIRQQLQILRNNNLIEFTSKGVYKIKSRM